MIDVPAELGAAVEVVTGASHACAIGEADGALVCWGSDDDGQATVPITLGSVIQVAAGGTHTCALEASHSLSCWGNDDHGQATVPAELQSVAYVAAGESHTCGIKWPEWSAVCWGSNTLGQADVPSELGDVSQLAAGGAHSCAVSREDDTLTCWGDDTYGQATVPDTLGPVTHVVAGARHTCATRKADGLVFCWGENDLAQATSPTWLGSVTEVAAGGSVSCASRTILVCWGDNTYGQLIPPEELYDTTRAPTGAPTAAPTASAVPTTIAAVTTTTEEPTPGLAPTAAPATTLTPTPAPTAAPTIEVNAATTMAVGGNHTCAIRREDGHVLCWGLNVNGQTDVPTGLSAATEVVAGSRHTCAIGDGGALTCWGANDAGQAAVPTTLGPVAQVASGGTHTCVIEVLGRSLTCWGDDTDGQAAVPAGINVVSNVATGDSHTCAIKWPEWEVVCWGSTSFGQADVPSGLGEVSHVAAGGAHSCAVRHEDGTLTCWGDDTYGQATVPEGVEPVTQVIAGATHTCATRKADGLVFCWGENNVFQANSPTWLGSVDEVAAGGSVSCAWRNIMVCWGDNTHGQLIAPPALYAISTEAPTMAPTPAPTAAPTFTTEAPTEAANRTTPTVDAGLAHTCAIRKEDGLVVCWGSNSSGQLAVPSGLGAATQVAAGGDHSCAVGEDQSLTCWGDDSAGQVTVPADLGLVNFVSAGGAHTCAIAVSGQLSCWGDNSDGQATVPVGLGSVSLVVTGAHHTCAISEADSGLTCWGAAEVAVPSSLGAVADIVAGSAHTCAIHKVGRNLTCWGNNSHGQADVPADLGPVTLVLTGDSHTCAVREVDSTLRCWGANTHGQATVPSFLGPVDTEQLAVGGSHTCAASLEDQMLICWGDDSQSQGTVPTELDGRTVDQGDDDPGDQATTTAAGLIGLTLTLPPIELTLPPIDVVSTSLSGTLDAATSSTSPLDGPTTVPVTKISSSTTSMPATTAPVPMTTPYPSLDSTTLTSSELAAATTVGLTTSVIPTSTLPAHVSTTLMLDSTTEAPRSTALATDTPTQPAEPTTQRAASTVAAETSTQLQLLSSSTAHPEQTTTSSQWDLSSSSTPGAATTMVGTSDPAAGGELTSTTMLSNATANATAEELINETGATLVAGLMRTCGIDEENRTLVCWGTDGDEGGRRLTVTPEMGGVAEVSAGRHHVCAIIEANYTFTCWGDDTHGQSSPPSDIGVVTQVAAGGYHSCAIDATDRTAVCWGSDSDGQASVPTSLGSVAQLAAGGHHTCAISSLDYSLTCWGRSIDGQTEIPTDLGAVSSVAAGHSHTCAVTEADGTLVCWGGNTEGQVNVPAALGAVQAVATKEGHTCAITEVDNSLHCWGRGGHNQTNKPADLGPVSQVATGGYHTCVVRSADKSVTCWGDDNDGQASVPRSMMKVADRLAIWPVLQKIRESLEGGEDPPLTQPPGTLPPPPPATEAPHENFTRTSTTPTTSITTTTLVSIDLDVQNRGNYTEVRGGFSLIFPSSDLQELLLEDSTSNSLGAALEKAILSMVPGQTAGVSVQVTFNENPFQANALEVSYTLKVSADQHEATAESVAEELANQVTSEASAAFETGINEGVGNNSTYTVVVNSYQERPLKETSEAVEYMDSCDCLLSILSVLLAGVAVFTTTISVRVASATSAAAEPPMGDLDIVIPMSSSKTGEKSLPSKNSSRSTRTSAESLPSKSSTSSDKWRWRRTSTMSKSAPDRIRPTPWFFKYFVFFPPCLMLAASAVLFVVEFCPVANYILSLLAILNMATGVLLWPSCCLLRTFIRLVSFVSRPKRAVAWNAIWTSLPLLPVVPVVWLALNPTEGPLSFWQNNKVAWFTENILSWLIAGAAVFFLFLWKLNGRFWKSHRVYQELLHAKIAVSVAFAAIILYRVFAWEEGLCMFLPAFLFMLIALCEWVRSECLCELFSTGAEEVMAASIGLTKHQADALRMLKQDTKGFNGALCSCLHQGSFAMSTTLVRFTVMTARMAAAKFVRDCLAVIQPEVDKQVAKLQCATFDIDVFDGSPGKHFADVVNPLLTKLVSETLQNGAESMRAAHKDMKKQVQILKEVIRRCEYYVPVEVFACVTQAKGVKRSASRIEGLVEDIQAEMDLLPESPTMSACSSPCYGRRSQALRRDTPFKIVTLAEGLEMEVGRLKERHGKAAFFSRCKVDRNVERITDEVLGVREDTTTACEQMRDWAGRFQNSFEKEGNEWSQAVSAFSQEESVQLGLFEDNFPLRVKEAHDSKCRCNACAVDKGWVSTGTCLQEVSRLARQVADLQDDVCSGIMQGDSKAMVKEAVRLHLNFLSEGQPKLADSLVTSVACMEDLLVAATEGCYEIETVMATFELVIENVEQALKVGRKVMRDIEKVEKSNLVDGATGLGQKAKLALDLLGEREGTFASTTSWELDAFGDGGFDGKKVNWAEDVQSPTSSTPPAKLSRTPSTLAPGSNPISPTATSPASLSALHVSFAPSPHPGPYQSSFMEDELREELICEDFFPSQVSAPATPELTPRETTQATVRPPAIFDEEEPEGEPSEDAQPPPQRAALAPLNIPSRNSRGSEEAKRRQIQLEALHGMAPNQGDTQAATDSTNSQAVRGNGSKESQAQQFAPTNSCPRRTTAESFGDRRSKGMDEVLDDEMFADVPGLGQTAEGRRASAELLMRSGSQGSSPTKALGLCGDRRLAPPSEKCSTRRSSGCTGLNDEVTDEDFLAPEDFDMQAFAGEPTEDYEALLRMEEIAAAALCKGSVKIEGLARYQKFVSFTLPALSFAMDAFILDKAQIALQAVENMMLGRLPADMKVDLDDSEEVESTEAASSELPQNRRRSSDMMRSCDGGRVSQVTSI